MLKDLDTNRFIEVDGIVISSRKYNEASSIIELLTDKLGKINIFIPGARHAKNEFSSISRLLAEGNYILQKSRNRFFVSSGQLENSNIEIASKPNNYLVAQYIMEIINRTALETSDENIFLLTKSVLNELRNDDARSMLLKIGYTIKYLSFIGFRPNISQCGICGDKKADEYFFSNELGGLICKKCLELDMKYVNLKTYDIIFLNELLYMKFSDYKNINTKNVNLNWIDNLVYLFFLYNTEINELETQNIYRKLSKD